MLSNLIRAVVIAVALVVLFLTPLFVTGPSGTTIEPVGAVVDALAVLAIVVAAGTWLAGRRRA